MTSNDRCVMIEKAARMEQTDISELPVGTVFHVVNGNWWGEITTVENQKAIMFLPSGVTQSCFLERSVVTYDPNEIRVSNLAHADGPKILNGSYELVIDEIRPISSK